MATQEYFKTAAAFLHRGAQAKKQEADELRSEIYRREAEVRRQVNDMREEIRRTEGRLIREAPDSSFRAVHSRRIAELEQEILALQHTFEDERKQKLEDAKRREQEMNEVESQARQLEAKQ